MRRRAFLLAAASSALLPAGCATEDDWAGPDIVGSPTNPVNQNGQVPAPEPTEAAEDDAADDEDGRPEDLDPDAYGQDPTEWGERVTGVRTRLDTDEQVVALTFDACGGPNGIGYDEQLISFLLAEEVPATLFLNARWIDANEDLVVRLAEEPLFELANHGTEHRPLSVTGASAYGLTGTASPAAVIDEVMINQERMTELTGSGPACFRSGTAHYDEIAARIVADLGLQVAGYDVLGDAGATYTADQVAAALGEAGAGSIALLHMNHPQSGTREGVRQAVESLRARGFDFARLGDYPLV